MPSARILIIDDERQTVDSLRDLLELYGYETEVALNKQVGITILHERKMDVAVIGAIVHEVSGVEILQEMKKLCPDLPVIMLGNQKSKRIKLAAIKAGVYEFIEKPVENMVILQKIDQLLELLFAPPPLKKTKVSAKSKK
ncbi:MAG TPA: response regulator [Candidatus Brocadiaceae bacterium]|jgi:DNA-binding NtrC family response regulator